MLGVLAVLAVILLLFMVIGVAEEERTDASGQWEYVVNTDGETATIWHVLYKETAQMDVPREIDGFRVTAIGDYAFFGYTESNTPERITLPDTVISIGDGTFQGCFSLTEVTLPASLISVGEYAFADCEALMQVIMPDSLTSYICIQTLHHYQWRRVQNRLLL